MGYTMKYTKQNAKSPAPYGMGSRGIVDSQSMATELHDSFVQPNLVSCAFRKVKEYG